MNEIKYLEKNKTRLDRIASSTAFRRAWFVEKIRTHRRTYRDLANLCYIDRLLSRQQIEPQSRQQQKELNSLLATGIRSGRFDKQLEEMG